MSWGDIDGPVRLGLLALVAAQLALMILALVRLRRTPEDRLALLPRWAWVLVIIAGQLLGPLVFLAVGRGPEKAADPLAQAGGDAGRPSIPSSLDRLYGRRQ